VFGLTRRSKAGWLLVGAGGALALAGGRAQSQPYHAELGSNILVNASPQDAYRFWRDLENSPRWMNHIESVNVLDQHRSHWTAAGPLGAKLQWTSEITDEREGESIAWRSLPGSDLAVEGRVAFQAAPNDRGTIVSSRVRYRLANRAFASAASGFLGRQANFFLRQDLRRFKALIETGEVATTDGQTHGPRSYAAAAARAFDPTRARRGEARTTEVFESLRRVS
jgi:uncharacterized membrane protein